MVGQVLPQRAYRLSRGWSRGSSQRRMGSVMYATTRASTVPMSASPQLPTAAAATETRSAITTSTTITHPRTSRPVIAVTRPSRPCRSGRTTSRRRLALVGVAACPAAGPNLEVRTASVNPSMVNGDFRNGFRSSGGRQYPQPTNSSWSSPSRGRRVTAGRAAPRSRTPPQLRATIDRLRPKLRRTASSPEFLHPLVVMPDYSFHLLFSTEGRR